MKYLFIVVVSNLYSHCDHQGLYYVQLTLKKACNHVKYIWMRNLYGLQL